MSERITCPWCGGRDVIEDHELAREIRRADHCHGIVTRDGEQDCCGKPPVAIIDGRGTEDGGYWPACAWHANRYGGARCVSLADLRAALRGDA